MKGVIHLPPFVLLYIRADLFSSLALLPTMLKAEDKGGKLLICEFARVILVSSIFFGLVTSFWSAGAHSKIISDHACLKATLKRDVARYYFANGYMPTEMPDFTSTLVNPLNNKELRISSAGTPLEFEIQDELENIILEGAKDLSGLASGVRDQDSYLHSVDVLINFSCE